MAVPVRLQLSRRKGFDLQALSIATNGLPAVNVARPGVFGNPISCSSPYGCPYSDGFEREAWTHRDGKVSPYRCCVDAYRHYVETGIAGEPTRAGYLVFGFEGMDGYPRRSRLVNALPSLRGKNVACWCKLTARCHGDVLLDLANRPVCEEA